MAAARTLVQVHISPGSGAWRATPRVRSTSRGLGICHHPLRARVTLWLPVAQTPYYLFALYAVLASAVFSGALRGIHIGSDLRFVERLDEAPYPPLDALPCWSHVFTVSRAPKVPVGFAFEGSVFEVS